MKGFNHIPAVIRSIDPAMGKFVEKVVLDIAAGASARAPIDTGALADSYHGESRGLEGTAGSNIEYAPYQEYGTIHNAAQPHLVPAAESVVNSINSYAKILQREAEGAARHG